MARVVLAARVRDDFDRVFDFLFEKAPHAAASHVSTIIAAVDVLQSSPLIGRPVLHGQRELVISAGASGYVALYRYDASTDTVRVLAVRAQRERGFRR